MNTNTAYRSETHNVIDAAQRAAERLHIELSTEALDAIDDAAWAVLQKVNNEERDRRAAEMRENTEAFIHSLFQMQLHGNSHVVTAAHVAWSLRDWCKNHKNHLPFCRED